MTKKEREKEVELLLKRFRRIQDEIAVAEEDAEALAFSQGSGEPVQSSTISDKTMRGALALLGVDQKRRWVECLTDALDWLEEEQPDLRRLIWGHYGMKYRRGYKRKYATAFTVSYCTSYHISYQEYDRRRHRGIEEITTFAVGRGLLKLERLKSENERKKTAL